MMRWYFVGSVFYSITWLNTSSHRSTARLLTSGQSESGFMASISSFQREEILFLSLQHHIFMPLDKMLYSLYSLFRELKFIVLFV